MAKESKVQVVEEFAGKIDGNSLIFFDYEGVDVTTLSELRKACREQGSQIKVLKNTLLKRALDDKKMSVAGDMLTGMTAVLVASSEEFGASGKVLLRAEKADNAITIKGGFFEAAEVDAEGVRKYAKLPGREELYSMLVGALEGVVNNLVVVLGQVGEQKASGGGTAEPEKAEAKESEKVEAKEPEKAEAKESEKVEAKEPEKAEAKESEKVEAKEPEKAEAKEPEKAEAKEGEKST